MRQIKSKSSASYLLFKIACIPVPRTPQFPSSPNNNAKKEIRKWAKKKVPFSPVLYIVWALVREFLSSHDAAVLLVYDDWIDKMAILSHFGSCKIFIFFFSSFSFGSGNYYKNASCALFVCWGSWLVVVCLFLVLWEYIK